MIVPVRQASFNGGEWDEGLWARTNLKRYSDALKLARNMIPLHEGPITNRPGLLYKGAAKTDADNARIKEFIFSTGTLAENYVLEFAPGVIRVWKAGVRMESPPGTPVEVTTTYTSAEIPRLKFVQRGDVVTIFCKQKTPRDLRRVSDTNWTITDRVVTRAIAAPANLAFITRAGNPPPETESLAAKVWQIVVTAVKAATMEESVPSGYIQASMAISANTPAGYQWDAVAGAAQYNIYRGRNGKFGYVGSSMGRTTFEDDGAYPVYAEVPPGERNPFLTADDQPQVGTFHDQRMVLANAWNNPGEVEGSRIGEDKNFDRASPPKTTDAVTFNVASNMYEEIRNLVSYGRSLVVMTNAQEQIVTGAEGIIAQDDLVFDDQPTHWGCSWLDALVVGGVILFVQDVGATVRELVPMNKQAGNDLTLLARHLFRGHTITSWCYAHEPYRVIWATREDGVLLSCTYVSQLETWAWAAHDTGTDLIEWVCSVPEGNENAVYALVKRYVGGVWKRYFERLAPRAGQALEDGVFLDSAITHTGSGFTEVTGLDHLEGQEVYALADGLPRGPFTVAAGKITLPVPADKAHVGLRITAQGQLLDVYSSQEEVRPRKKTVKKVYMEVSGSMPFKAGQRLTDTLETTRHPDDDPWTTPRTGLVQVSIDSDWDDSGSVVWEHTDPTPLTIKSVTREVDFGGA